MVSIGCKFIARLIMYLLRHLILISVKISARLCRVLHDYKKENLRNSGAVSRFYDDVSVGCYSSRGAGTPLKGFHPFRIPFFGVGVVVTIVWETCGRPITDNHSLQLTPVCFHVKKHLAHCNYNVF